MGNLFDETLPGGVVDKGRQQLEALQAKNAKANTIELDPASGKLLQFTHEHARQTPEEIQKQLMYGARESGQPLLDQQTGLLSRQSTGLGMQQNPGLYSALQNKASRAFDTDIIKLNKQMEQQSYKQKMQRTQNAAAALGKFAQTNMAAKQNQLDLEYSQKKAESDARKAALGGILTAAGTIIGTAIAPGVGTAIGAGIGGAVGSVASNAGGK